jgi:hypothetical protein
LVNKQTALGYQVGHCPLIVSERVVVYCRDPAVAVTVTAEVTGGFVFAGVLMEAPPPHPLSKDRPATHATNMLTDSQRRRFIHQSPPSDSTRTDGGSNGLGPAGRADFEEGAVMVTVVETGPPEGVTVAGEKLHEAPTGNPEQLNDTAALNPFIGVSEIDTEALCPAANVTDVVDGAIVNSGGGAVTMYCALAIALFA